MPPVGTAQEVIDIIRNKALTAVFQPIVDLRASRLFGYEALTRGPADSGLHSPLTLFESAGRYGLMGALEFACREVACSRFTQQNGKGKLFLNVSPMSLVEPGYQLGMTHRILDQLGLPADRIVIELSEQYPLDDYAVMRNATAHFRRMGFQIAMDDLGAGYAGLRAWSELRPDYVKVDRHFIEQVDSEPVKREFLRSILEIANEIGCLVVAEGIETAEQLATVRSLGVHFGQGYFLGRPAAIAAPSEEVLERLQLAPCHQRRFARRSMAIGDLAIPAPTIDAQTSLDRVLDLLQAHRGLNSLPVVADRRPVGLIRRAAILELFAGRYSRELYGRKQASQFMDRNAMVVAHTHTLEEASQHLTANGEEPLSQDFIVTRGGDFFGVVRTSELLRRITEQQMRSARYANPLTQLPGNVPLHELLDELLQRGEPFTIAWFDLDHFKPYNDHYGYSRGDGVILFVAQLIEEYLNGEAEFVAHVGGDDFVVVSRESDWDLRCQQLLVRFDAEIGRFYDAEARAQGGLAMCNRAGEQQFFPLLSLSIGAVQPDPGACHSHHQVAALAGDAKREAKRIVGSALFLSRRRRPDSPVAAPPVHPFVAAEL